MFSYEFCKISKKQFFYRTPSGDCFSSITANFIVWNVQYRWKNGWLPIFYRNNNSTFERHSWKLTFLLEATFFGNKHITAERITQTMVDCKFSRKNKHSTLKRTDDCHERMDGLNWSSERSQYSQKLMAGRYSSFQIK